ncbi:MAG: hypothetical protein ABIS06_04640 [Vicinamibacterales bacterium]
MSDPRNVAHAKKVTQEKKHRGTGRGPDETTVQPDKKTAAANESQTASPPAALEGSLTVLGKLKEMEFHSRANLERLAELSLTVEDELKQKDILGPLGEVQSAQNAFQTKLTALLETYQAECDRMQGPAA